MPLKKPARTLEFQNVKLIFITFERQSEFTFYFLFNYVLFVSRKFFSVNKGPEIKQKNYKFNVKLIRCHAPYEKPCAGSKT